MKPEGSRRPTGQNLEGRWGPRRGGKELEAQPGSRANGQGGGLRSSNRFRGAAEEGGDGPSEARLAEDASTGIFGRCFRAEMLRAVAAFRLGLFLVKGGNMRHDRHLAHERQSSYREEEETACYRSFHHHP